MNPKVSQILKTERRGVPMDSRVATIDGQKIIILVFALTISITGSILVNGWLILISLGLSLIIIYQIILRAMFAGPKTRSPSLSNKDYTIIKVNNDGVDIYGYVNYQSKKSDLVVFLHGWMSSSERFLERMQLFHSRGFHTLAHDMRGHGIAPETHEWTAGKVIRDLMFLLQKVDQNMVNKIHFYGHSLGGYVCIGMHNHRHKGWWKERYGTMILESPMSAYSPILKEMSGKLSVLGPLLKKWALNGFSKIHPEYGKIEWREVDVPHWGLPKCPVLILQSADDRRLGRYHYDLLMEQQIDVEAHLIESLPHARNRINPERDELIISWIEQKML